MTRQLVLGMVLAATAYPAAAGMFGPAELPQIAGIRIEVESIPLDKLPEIETTAAETAGAVPIGTQETMTLRELVGRACPGASDAYMAALPQAITDLQAQQFPVPPNLDEVTVTPDQTILVPYCLGSSTTQYVVQDGDGLWKVWDRQKDYPTGIKDYDTFVAGFEYLNDGYGVDTILQPGTEVAIPPSQVTIPVLKEDVDPTLSKFRELGLKAHSVENMGGFNVEYGHPPAPDAAAGVCREVDELGPLNAAREHLWTLADALVFNDEIDDATQRFSRKLDTVGIAVLDTGILGADLPLTKRTLRPMWRNDRGSVDRDYAANQDYAAHGTAVAFTAAGGAYFSLLNPLIGAINVVPANIYGVTCPNGNCIAYVKEGEVERALQMLDDGETGVEVVNISSALPSPIWNLDAFIGLGKPLLFTTSAGNDGIRLTSDSRIFPAVSGGNELQNVVTVAAVGLDGQWSANSNYSPSLVDIAAWGCNVPILVFDKNLAGYASILESGTSLAAPQVAFAAAMVLRERHSQGQAITAIDVKFRLIAASDIAPGLMDKVKDGRILNLEKAVLVHTDLVEMKAPGRPLLRGKVEFGTTAGSEVTLCGGVTVDRSDILKITQLDPAPSPGRQFMIYHGSTRGDRAHFDRAFCPKILPELIFTPVGGEEKTTLPFADVKDVVMAMWE